MVLTNAKKCRGNTLMLLLNQKDLINTTEKSLTKLKRKLKWQT